MRKRFKLGVVAALAFAVGCGDSTGPQIELSDAEAEQLFEVLDAILGNLDFGAGFAQANPGLPGLMLSVAGMPPVNESANCSQGGNVSISGNADGDETSASYDVTLAFNNCGEDDHVVDGDLNYSGDASFANDTFSFSVDVDGTLTVTLPDDRTGSCRFDYSVTVNSNSASVSGSVCGHDISGNANF